jgi:hypothetical protein
MRRIRKLNRRSFLASVAGSAAAGSLLAVSGEAAAQSGCSDSDPSDPVGRGVRCTRGGTARTGCSDRDPGGTGDPGGRGRNCVATGCSDSDPSDPGGSGRNCGGRTGNQHAGSEVRGRCTYEGCACTSFVQPDEGWSCARSGCGHHYNWHENPEV